MEALPDDALLYLFHILAQRRLPLLPSPALTQAQLRIDAERMYGDTYGKAQNVAQRLANGALAIIKEARQALYDVRLLASTSKRMARIVESRWVFVYEEMRAMFFALRRSSEVRVLLDTSPLQPPRTPRWYALACLLFAWPQDVWDHYDLQLWISYDMEVEPILDIDNDAFFRTYTVSFWAPRREVSNLPGPAAYAQMSVAEKCELAERIFLAATSGDRPEKKIDWNDYICIRSRYPDDSGAVLYRRRDYQQCGTEPSLASAVDRSRQHGRQWVELKDALQAQTPVAILKRKRAEEEKRADAERLAKFHRF